MFDRHHAFEAPRKLLACLVAYALILGSTPAFAHSSGEKTATPIKHIVVIFGENISFDHYFGSYPNAMNPKGSRLLCTQRNADRQRPKRSVAHE